MLSYENTDPSPLQEICRRLEAEELYGGLEKAVERFGKKTYMLPPLQKLESRYDLELPGVRALLREYLREFTEIFEAGPGLRIYASVPMPYAMALCVNSGQAARIYTAEYCAMVVMGGIFGLDINGYVSKGCGSCAMLDNRRNFISEGILPRPDMLLSFGLLCDECCKTDELLQQEGIEPVTVRCPHSVEDRFLIYKRDIEEAIKRIAERSGEMVLFSREQRELWLRTQLLISMISCKNNHSSAPLLKSGSMSLINSIALIAFGRPGAVAQTLDRIWEDMKTLKPLEERTKLYCYYIPPCLPQLGEMFRENGIELIGDSAFISLPIEKNKESSLAQLCADSWRSSVLSRSNLEFAKETAKKIRQYDCRGYLTGMFSFDRWLGNGHSLTKRMVEELSGRPVHMLPMDFWGRGFVKARALNYVQTICRAMGGEEEAH